LVLRRLPSHVGVVRGYHFTTKLCHLANDISTPALVIKILALVIKTVRRLSGRGGNLIPSNAHLRRSLKRRWLMPRRIISTIASGCAAGAQALADYELLELLLFRAMPRRGVKPLAKDLLARFGSFAEVISAPVERLRELGNLSESLPSPSARSCRRRRPDSQRLKWPAFALRHASPWRRKIPATHIT
jgi:hypothetical protein